MPGPPPARFVIAWSEAIPPAKDPAVPPAVVVTMPNAGNGATPLVVLVALGIVSATVSDSAKVKASPAVVTANVVSKLVGTPELTPAVAVFKPPIAPAELS